MQTSQRHPRILIVRLSAIGDVVHGLPVLCALRAAYPQAFLAWVVEGRTAEILRCHPALDELIVVPRGWLKRAREVWTLARTLRRLEFDTAIDVQGLTKSAVAARLSGAKRRVGFDGVDGREVSRWLNNRLVLPAATHVVDRNLELLRALDIDRPQARFDLTVPPADHAAADRLLEGLSLAGPFAVINPGAGWPSKLWPAERFAAVAHRLGQSRGVPSLVVWAGAQERAAAEQIVAASGSWAKMAPPTSLGELVAIARRATLFLSSDTGPLHLAAAVGTPCVGLFGPMPAERNGPYGPGHIAVEKMRMTGASRERRTAGPEVMQSINVDDVCTACEQILQRESAVRRSA
ncbi:MAG: glycosyltransferase family 9 protein [Pirellulales bacterium]